MTPLAYGSLCWALAMSGVEYWCADVFALQDNDRRRTVFAEVDSASESNANCTTIDHLAKNDGWVKIAVDQQDCSGDITLCSGGECTVIAIRSGVTYSSWTEPAPSREEHDRELLEMIDAANYDTGVHWLKSTEINLVLQGTTLFTFREDGAVLFKGEEVANTKIGYQRLKDLFEGKEICR